LSFVFPHVDQSSRTVTVRFELDNPGHKLRPGGTADVTLTILPQQVASLVEAVTDANSKAMLEEGKVLAVPESSVIDTGKQKIVYRETAPGVFEGVEVALGPKMSDAEGAVFYPVLGGVAQGDRVVTSGSFLVDAETRLNPAAGSIYFGNSGGSASSSSVSNVRPSTPDDPQAKINAALAKLSPEDRALVAAQKFCPILTSNQLGSMGPPVKLMIDGQPVFLCCSGCKQNALANSQATLAKVAELKKQTQAAANSPATANPSVNSEVAPVPGTAAETPQSSADSDAANQAALAKLAPADRALVEEQKFCPVTGNALGSMGTPLKLMIEDQPVFLCCEGCKGEAIKNSKATLDKVAKLKQATSPKK
jgi:membrane fusion protein, copper/silver efflux system